MTSKMIAVKETNAEAQKYIKESLLSNSCSYSAVIQASLNVKKLFKPPDKIFSRLQLQSLLHITEDSVKNKLKERELLVNYGKCLVQHLGKDINLHSELLHHIKYILIKAQTEHDDMLDELVDELCNKFENEKMFHAVAILNLPKEAIEMIVLNWIDLANSPHMALVAKMSAGSPKLFQMVTSILCEALMRTNGHEGVLEVTNLFVQSVKCECLREKRDFLKLYPKSLCQLVSLLMVPPKVHSDGGKGIVSEVVPMLFEMFVRDRQKAFFLLSHYSYWVSPFISHLGRNTQVVPRIN